MPEGRTRMERMAGPGGGRSVGVGAWVEFLGHIVKEESWGEYNPQWLKALGLCETAGKDCRKWIEGKVGSHNYSSQV